MDIKYRGISKKDILKVQELHVPKYSVPPALDKFDLSQFGTTEFSAINQTIDKIAKREAYNTDIYIICEMAKLYLETLEKSRCCGTCKWYAEFEGVCCNGDSEHRADFRCLDDTCSAWSRMEI